MRAIIFAVLPVLLLASCYTKGDAVEQLQAMGRPTPIKCVSLNGNDNSASASYVCTDGEGISWGCDADGCIRWPQ